MEIEQILKRKQNRSVNNALIKTGRLTVITEKRNEYCTYRWWAVDGVQLNIQANNEYLSSCDMLELKKNKIAENEREAETERQNAARLELAKKVFAENGLIMKDTSGNETDFDITSQDGTYLTRFERNYNTRKTPQEIAETALQSLKEHNQRLVNEAILRKAVADYLITLTENNEWCARYAITVKSELLKDYTVYLSGDDICKDWTIDWRGNPIEGGLLGFIDRSATRKHEDKMKEKKAIEKSKQTLIDAGYKLSDNGDGVLVKWGRYNIATLRNDELVNPYTEDDPRKVKDLIERAKTIKGLIK